MESALPGGHGQTPVAFWVDCSPLCRLTRTYSIYCTYKRHSPPRVAFKETRLGQELFANTYEERQGTREALEVSTAHGATFVSPVLTFTTHTAPGAR